MSQTDHPVPSAAPQGIPFALLVASNAVPVLSTEESLLRKAAALETFLDSRPSLRVPGIFCFTTHGGPTIEDTTSDTTVHDGNNTFKQPDTHTDKVDEEPSQQD